LLLVFWTENALREAIAETDQLDPGWRWEELEAKRAVVAADANSAECVLRAYRLLPTPWPIGPAKPATRGPHLDGDLRALAPTVALAPGQVSRWTADLASAQLALVEARKLKDLPAGRYPVVLHRNGLPEPSAHLQAAHTVTTLLGYDALLRGQAADSDGALESCRGLVNVARSFGDEPNHVAQQARMELRGSACRMLERILAQGSPSEANLVALQRLLGEEAPQPLFLHGARGLRWWLDGLTEPAHADRLALNRLHRLGLGVVGYARPAVLRMTTRVVEIAKLPMEDQADELRQRGLPRQEKVSLLVARLFYPRLQKVTGELSAGQVRSEAAIRCGVAAIAVERYRRAHGAWPASLDELVPAYLRAVPRDPLGKQPLRYRHLADGVVVYCLRPDGGDNGGQLDRQKGDIGLHLWNLTQRYPRLLAP
jgi:hypothetical protein